MTDLLNTSLADRYASLKARVEELEIEMKRLREEILATGQEIVEGDRCIVLVKLSDRTTVDWKAAAAAHLAEDVRKQCEIAFAKVTKNIATLAIKPKL